MPFIEVLGLPKDMSSEEMVSLRWEIVSVVARQMNCQSSWVRPFFVQDMLGEPEMDGDGANTIYVRLDTAMFSGELDDETLPLDVTSALAQVVWDAFGGKREVEVFIGELNPKWKKLLKAS